MKITLKIWRQKDSHSQGSFHTYNLNDVDGSMSFLDMLDLLNEKLVSNGDIPVEYDYDCREGICGSCGLVINGQAHGPKHLTATCQLHMRNYNDGDVLVIEPFRANALKVIRDLVVDRSPFDRIIQAGGYISIGTGSAPESNSILVNKDHADEAFNYAACIGCGACVAACPNASASLFTGAKIAHLSLLPHGHPERKKRAKAMVKQMEKENFGDCSNFAECEAVCPKGISISSIAIMRKEFIK